MVPTIGEHSQLASVRNESQTDIRVAIGWRVRFRAPAAKTGQSAPGQNRTGSLAPIVAVHEAAAHPKKRTLSSRVEQLALPVLQLAIWPTAGFKLA